MRRTRSLRKLRKSFQSHMSRLRNVRAHTAVATSVQDLEIHISHATINLLNLWNNFSRAYYLSCMLQARLETGQRITVAFPGLTYNDAIGVAVRIFRPHATPNAAGVWDKRDEPKWYVRDDMLRISQHALGPHDAHVQAAFSLSSRVFLDLPVSRNYFAHKNQQTSRTASDLATQYTIPATRRPSQVLLSRPAGRPQPLIDEWIDDLLNAAELLCL